MSFDIEGIIAANPLEVVAGHYTKLTRKGQEFAGCCPIHGGDNPGAFTVWRGTDGDWRYKCFTRGCESLLDTKPNVIGFIMNIESLDFQGACGFLGGVNGAKREWKPSISNPPRPKMPERITSRPPADAPRPGMSWKFRGFEPNAPRTEPENVREFRDLDGALLGFEARYPRGCDPDEPEKSPSRMWTWADGRFSCGHFSKGEIGRPLYGLHRITEKDKERGKEAPILVTEGPKKADAAALLMSAYASLSWTSGYSGWKAHDWTPLSGRAVLLWPDNDVVGIKAMHDLAAILADPKGLACSVKILRPQDDETLPPAFDCADWNDELHGSALKWCKAHVSEYVPISAVNDTIDTADVTVTESVAPEPNAAPEGVASPSPSVSPAMLAPSATDPDPEAAQETPHRLASTAAEVPAAEPAPASDTPEQPQSDDQPPDIPEPPPPAGSTASKPPRKRRPLPEPPADADLVPMGEDFIADRFAGDYGADWRYVKKWNMWLHFNDAGWNEDEKELIDRTVVEHCRKAAYWPEANQAGLSPDARRSLARRTTAGNIRDLARNDRRIAAGVDEWDAEPLLIGIHGGGAFDVTTGYMVPTAREQYLTKRTAIKPALGQPDKWLAHLDRMMDGDVDMIHFIKMWFGYCATGSTQEQCLTMFYGMGQTGKGVTLLTVQDVMGSHAIAAGASTFMASQNQAHLTELARLTNRRLVIVDEVPTDARWNEERIKRATGGGKLTCNYMHSNMFEQNVTWKVTLASNHKPSMRSVGKDMQRRIRLVKCNAGIPDDQVQRDFRQNMVAAEGPQILNWILEGAEEWHREGLPLPEQIRQATADYVDGLDALGDWLAAHTEQQGETPRPKAYNSFKQYMERNGGHPWGVQAWWSAMEDRGYTIRRTAAARIIKGLTVIGGDDEPPPNYDYADR